MKPALRAFETVKFLDLLALVAAHNGDAQNASEIGRQLGISYHAVFRRFDTLQGMGLTRVLRAAHSRRSHVQLRDCRLLHVLGGTPLAIMRTCLTECIVKGRAAGACGLTCWESGRVKRLDLVVPVDRERIGFVFTQRQAPRNRDLAPLRLAVENGVIDRGFLVHQGVMGFVAARVVIGLPVGELLGQLGRWLACRSFREAHEVLRERIGSGLTLRDARAYPPASCAFATCSSTAASGPAASPAVSTRSA